MAYLNRMTLIGNLGQDPEIRYQANGDAVANLSVATTETWRDKATGEQKEKTEWHKVVVFGKSCEYLAQYATKGSQVYVEGKLQTRKWQDQSNQDRYVTEIIVSFPHGTVDLLGHKATNQQQRPNQQQQHPNQQQQHPNQQQSGWEQPSGWE